MCVEPNSPCSSPDTAAKITVARNPFAPAALLTSRADSTLTETPEASSSAPGASRVRVCDRRNRRNRIEMSRHDEYGLRHLFVGAGQDRVDVLHRRRLAESALAGRIEFIDDDLQLAAGGFVDFVQARDDFVAAAAGAALWIVPDCRWRCACRTRPWSRSARAWTFRRPKRARSRRLGEGSASISATVAAVRRDRYADAAQRVAAAMLLSGNSNR